MKKAISVLWTIFIICIIVFIISFFVVESTAGMWRVFSIVMPLAGISFWGPLFYGHWMIGVRGRGNNDNARREGKKSVTAKYGKG